MDRWEYKQVQDRRGIGTDLDGIGSEGWELVAVIKGEADRPRYFFKRLKQPPPDAQDGTHHNGASSPEET